MPIRRSPSGARHPRPQAGRDRPEWVVAINRNGWSQSIVTAGRNRPLCAIRQMPEELQAIDRKYRIKSEHEGFERNVLECNLTAPDRDEHEYASPKPLRRSGGH